MLIPYQVGQNFAYNNTIYKIIDYTNNAVEISSNAAQSLWVSRQQLENLLGIKGRAGLFTWHNHLIR